MIKKIQMIHKRDNCNACNIFISSHGLQCANCLACDWIEIPNNTDKTLGELLESKNETIKRNAMSILKTLNK